MVLGQRVEGPLDVAADQRSEHAELRVAEERRLLRLVQQARFFGAHGSGDFTAFAAATVDVEIAQDTRQPRAHAAASMKRLARLESAQISLLDEVSRVRLLRAEPDRQAIGAVERGERLFHHQACARLVHGLNLSSRPGAFQGTWLPAGMFRPARLEHFARPPRQMPGTSLEEDP